MFTRTTFIRFLSVMISLFSFYFVQMDTENCNVHAQKIEPLYAKWGIITLKKTKEKYPNSQIIDYLHIGREEKLSTSIEKFKLRLREDNREFSVFVYIEFITKTEEIVHITFRETT